MNIVVFGANGPTGRQATEQALAVGHTVADVDEGADVAVPRGVAQ
ncbi:hypothetical protein [Streptomyces flavalbus]|uniref:NAD(P)H-binding protein n=1 Tax=Streptomyces flavalbus TaxID=2665155 RepID=A0ABW2WH23_9ACTN